ncbi:hypothetical protein CGJ01_23925, partial [Vibrio parahaemolyticus]
RNCQALRITLKCFVSPVVLTPEMTILIMGALHLMLTYQYSSPVQYNFYNNFVLFPKNTTLAKKL